MSQPTLKSFFNISNKSSDDEEVGHPQNDLKYYQELVSKQNLAKDFAKINVCYVSGGAECWKYFGHLQINNKKVLSKMRFCQLCFDGEHRTLKGFGESTSTSNHINHLKAKHSIDVKSVHFKRNISVTRQALCSTDKNTNFTHARRLAEMCCVDLTPFNIVEREGFRRYVHKLDSSTSFPSADTVATTALDNVYDVYLEAVKDLIQKTCPNDVSLVLDMWTDNYKKVAYINMKIHYCQDFSLNTVSLKTEQFPHPHSGRSIADKIKSTLTEFGLDKKNIKAVTDGGTNIISALKLCNIERYPCLAHTLHTYISKDILGDKERSDLRNVIRKVKQIFGALVYRREDISHFQQLKENENLYDKINEIYTFIQMDENYAIGELEAELENELNRPHSQSLKNSVETRWNSLLIMLKSFVQNMDAINFTLLKTKNEDLIIQDMEKKKIHELTEFLGIFSDATTYLQGQKYCTTSAWIYFFESICSELREKETWAEFATTIHMYQIAKEKFVQRFSIKKVHVISALLDPCQKNWEVLNNYIKKIPSSTNLADTFVLEDDVSNPTSKEKLLYQEIQSRNLSVGSSTINLGECPSNKPKVSGARRKMLTFLSGSETSCRNDSLQLEIEKYFKTDVCDVESLDWWLENRVVFPKVALLASIYFGIPASSASSEMAFSAAGSCITDRRSRLNPSTVKKQLFIHDNYNLVGQNL